MGLGGLFLRATLVPFDTKINTSLWDCRNYSRNDDGKGQREQGLVKRMTLGL